MPRHRRRRAREVSSGVFGRVRVLVATAAQRSIRFRRLRPAAHCELPASAGVWSRGGKWSRGLQMPSPNSTLRPRRGCRLAQGSGTALRAALSWWHPYERAGMPSWCRKNTAGRRRSGSRRRKPCALLSAVARAGFLNVLLRAKSWSTGARDQERRCSRRRLRADPVAIACRCPLGIVCVLLTQVGS